MAILAPLFAALGRFAGRALTTTLGWASTLLFGRMSSDRQLLLAAITFGSVIWVVLLVGVVVPDVGTFLLGFVPVPDFIDETWVRLAMLAAALVLPLVVGLGVLLIIDADERPSGGDAVMQVLRGYPLTAALAIVLVFLAVVGVTRKGRVILKRWSDAHVPMVVRPGGYGRVVDDLEAALDDARLDVRRVDAPAVLAVPGRLLAAVAGPSIRSLVPERLQMLQADDLEVLIHQSDVAIAGSAGAMARARAAVASRLTATAAYRTTSKEAQTIEERLEALSSEPLPAPDRISEELLTLDALLATVEVDDEEWEVLYRIRLQVERDLLVGRLPGTTFPGDAADVPAPPRHRPSPLGAALAGLVAFLLAIDVIATLRERSSADR
jgi:hypothetical protein